MKKIIGFVFLIAVSNLFSASLNLIGAKLTMDLPASWKYYGAQTNNGMAIHIYKRSPITNRYGRSIIPALIIMNEKTIADDSVVYFVNKRVQHQFENTQEILTRYDNATAIPSAIILHSANYNSRAALVFDSILMTFMYGNCGITIIFNVTYDVYPQIKNEIFAILKTIALDTKKKIVPVIETTFQDKGKTITQIISERGTTGIAKDVR